MKLLAIAGTNADFSYNRFLEQFMAKHYRGQAEIEIYEIADPPRFKKEVQPDSKVEEFKDKIHEADGVIFATPEYNHGIPSSLESTMGWTSSHAQGSADMTKMRPVMALGASRGIQGASRAQEGMHEILLSLGQSANALLGNEISIGHAADKFGKNTGGSLGQGTIHAIGLAFNNSIKLAEQVRK